MPQMRDFFADLKTPDGVLCALAVVLVVVAGDTSVALGWVLIGLAIALIVVGMPLANRRWPTSDEARSGNPRAGAMSDLVARYRQPRNVLVLVTFAVAMAAVHVGGAIGWAVAVVAVVLLIVRGPVVDQRAPSP
jgi:hypothetical protein